ncbi:MAG: FliA/WhiG family RNA polymerase sigma factor [Planctomycetota bacterium]|nr:MAG: FliA/WhiG family RNA polymerase sigma factor [Planctomycetota bacterium]
MTIDPTLELAAEEPEEERLSAEELWLEFRRSGDQALRDELVERHQPLVCFLAERLCATLPASVDVDDMVQEGNFGLMDAIEKFDPGRAVKFKTYCSTRIRGAMLDALRSQDWVPRLVRQRSAQLQRLRQAWLTQYGSEPPDKEVARVLGTTVKGLAAMLPKATPTTIHNVSDRRVAPDAGAEGDIDTLRETDEADPFDEADRKDLMEVLGRCLTQKERTILTLYHLEGLTLREIGLRLGLTESRVCQIHSSILKRLRNRHDREKLR